MKKRILFITDYLYGGGSERVLTTLANSFCHENTIVEIVAFFSFPAYPIKNEINIIEINTPRNYLNAIKQIRSIVKTNNPDIIISFGYSNNIFTLLACIGIKKKIIVSERNDPAAVGGVFPKKQLRNFSYRFCSTLVCQTNDAKNYFPTYIQKKTTVILNPLKEGLPKPWEGERTNVIVTFCRLHKQKNLTLLIDAFEAFHVTHQDYVLKIYGDGPEKEKIDLYIKKKGLENSAFLLENDPDVHNKILRSKMFVLPSDYEGLSNSMLEAMAIGLPTICTDCPCGGARMIIKNEENGLLIPVGDETELVCSMNKIADNPEFANKLSKNGMKLREQLSIDNISKQWICLFEN